MEPASPSPSQPAAVPPTGDPVAAPQPAAVGAQPVAATGAPAEEPGSPTREREARRPRDMIISLLVLLIPIALLLTMYRVLLDGDAPITKDPSSAIQQASQEFTVAQPAGLSDDWHIVSANFRRETGGATLRIGYVDPDDDPVLLVQSSVPSATLVPAEVGPEGARTGTFRDDARTWLVYSGRPGETALIATEQNRTIVILGKTDRENLETLAASLG